MWRLLARAALVGPLLVGSGVAQAQAPAPDLPPRRTADEDPGGTPGTFELRHVYLQLSPGIVGVPLTGPPRPLYAWGLGAGVFVPVGERFAVAGGGFFEHMTRKYGETVQDEPYVGRSHRQHRVRFGGELRLGAQRRKLFGYALARLGLDVDVDRGVEDVVGMKSDFAPGAAAGLLTTVGVGLQVLFAGRLLFGAEPAVDLGYVRGGFSPMFRGRVLLGVTF